MNKKLNRLSILISTAVLALSGLSASAQPYDTGATDKEIKIGNTNP